MKHACPDKTHAQKYQTVKKYIRTSELSKAVSMAFIVQLVNRASKVTSPATELTRLFSVLGVRDISGYFTSTPLLQSLFKTTFVYVGMMHGLINPFAFTESCALSVVNCCRTSYVQMNCQELDRIAGSAVRETLCRVFHGKEELCVNLCLSNQL